MFDPKMSHSFIQNIDVKTFLRFLFMARFLTFFILPTFFIFKNVH